MILKKRKGYEATTVRGVLTDDREFVAVVGTIEDLIAVEILRGVPDKWKWAAISKEGETSLGDSREEALQKFEESLKEEDK